MGCGQTLQIREVGALPDEKGVGPLARTARTGTGCDVLWTNPGETTCERRMCLFSSWTQAPRILVTKKTSCRCPATNCDEASRVACRLLRGAPSKQAPSYPLADWLFKGGFKVSSGTVAWYRSSCGTDFIILKHPALHPLAPIPLLPAENNPQAAELCRSKRLFSWQGDETHEVSA